MRALYRRFPLGKKGYTVDDLQKISEEFAGSSLKVFFDNYVHGTTPLDWEKSLLYAGLDLRAKDSDGKPWLGAQTMDQSGRLLVRGVVIGSPASEARLDIGDEIVALNGKRVRSTDFQERITECKAGDVVKLTVFRDDALREIPVTLRLPDVPSYSVTKVDQPTSLQKAIYESLLKTTW
jgi:predicted metalloprotease with PDZ domain